MAGTREAEADLNWLMPRLKAFWLEGRFTDVTVTVQNEEFHCHRLVLAAFSRVLKAMLRTNMREGNERKVKLGGVTALTFRRVLNFLYGMHFSLDENDAEDLLQVSDMLDIPSLKLRCAVDLAGRLSPQNCLDMWSLARTHDCPALAKEARTCTARHFRTLCKTPAFLSLEPDQLESMLGDDRLGAPVEEEVFYALSNWLVRDPQARGKYMDKLLDLVRFPLMDSLQLNESIARRVVALRSERGLKLLREAQDYHATYDLRHLLTSSRMEPRAESLLMAAIVVIGNQLGSEGCFSLLAYSLRERLWRASTGRVEMTLGCAVCPWGGGFYSAGGLCSSSMYYYNLHTPGPSGTRVGQGGKEPGRQCAPMPNSRIHHGLLAFGRRLFLFGGWQWQSMAMGRDEALDGCPAVLEYTVNRDAWRTAGMMAQGRERINGYVRDRHRILAYCAARGFSLKYFDTETCHSALLSLSLAELTRLCGRRVSIEVFDVCPISHHHVMVTGCGDVVSIRVGPSDDVRVDVSQIDLSQELKMYSTAQGRGCLYVLGGLAEEGDRQETVSQCQGLGQALNVVRVPGPYAYTWAYSSFYMNVHKSRFQKIVSKTPAANRQSAKK